MGHRNEKDFCTKPGHDSLLVSEPVPPQLVQVAVRATLEHEISYLHFSAFFFCFPTREKAAIEVKNVCFAFNSINSEMYENKHGVNLEIA